MGASHPEDEVGPRCCPSAARAGGGRLCTRQHPEDAGQSPRTRAQRGRRAVRELQSEAVRRERSVGQGRLSPSEDEVSPRVPERSEGGSGRPGEASPRRCSGPRSPSCTGAEGGGAAGRMSRSQRGRPGSQNRADEARRAPLPATHSAPSASEASQRSGYEKPWTQAQVGEAKIPLTPRSHAQIPHPKRRRGADGAPSPLFGFVS